MPGNSEIDMSKSKEKDQHSPNYRMSYQDVAIALFGRGRDHFAPVLRFGLLLAVAASLGQGLIAFTPLADVWLGGVSGLSAELVAFARLPLQILAIVPALSVMQAMQRALLVQARVTAPVTWGTVIEVGGILLGLLLAISGFDWIGATAAAAAFLFGRIAGNLFLVSPCLRILRDD